LVESPIAEIKATKSRVVSALNSLKDFSRSEVVAFSSDDTRYEWFYALQKNFGEVERVVYAKYLTKQKRGGIVWR